MDLVLLWLWYRLAAIAPTGPLAWKPPDTVGAALKRKKKKTKKKKKKKRANMQVPRWKYAFMISINLDL